MNIVITGKIDRRRHVVWLDDQRVILSNKSFHYLMRLAWALIKRTDAKRSVSDGWIHRSELDGGNVQAVNLCRFRREIELQAKVPSAAWLGYESDGYKRVRLLADRKGIILDKAVADLPDPEIQLMVAEIKRKRK